MVDFSYFAVFEICLLPFWQICLTQMQRYTQKMIHRCRSISQVDVPVSLCMLFIISTKSQFCYNQCNTS